jgi:hypothetical protein
MEHRWNETDRAKPKNSGKNLSQCHFVHHKSHMKMKKKKKKKKKKKMIMMIIIIFVLFLIMEYRWNETDRGKPKNSGENLSQCHFVYHKSHMD